MHPEDNLIEIASRKVTKKKLKTDDLPKFSFPIPETENGFEQWISYSKGVIRSVKPEERSEYLRQFERSSHCAYCVYMGDGIYGYCDWEEIEPHRVKAFSDMVSWMREEKLDFDATYLYEDLLSSTSSGPAQLNKQIDILQKNGFFPHKESPYIQCLWREIIMGGRKGVAELLLKKGFVPEWDPSVDAKANGRALAHTIYEGSDTMLRLVKSKQSVEVIKIFDKNILKPMVHVVNKKGETALHDATRDLLSGYVEYLVSLGADKSLKNKKGQTPFDCIKRTKSRQGELEKIVKILGATTEKTPEELFSQAVKTLDFSLFRLGVQKGGDLANYAKKDTLGFFAGIFPDIPESRLNKTRKMQEETALYLLNLGVFDFPDKHDQNALHYACKNGAVSVAIMILEKHPEFAYEKSMFGKTPGELKMDIAYRITPHLNLYDKNIFRQTLAKNQQDIAKMYVKKGVKIGEFDFPNIRNTPETKAWLEKALLKQAVGEKAMGDKKVVSTEKRKM